MNQPCEKADIINEIHSSVKETRRDVKLLLANYHKRQGQRQLQKKWFSRAIKVGTLIVGILGAIKLKGN